MHDSADMTQTIFCVFFDLMTGVTNFSEKKIGKGNFCRWGLTYNTSNHQQLWYFIESTVYFFDFNLAAQFSWRLKPEEIALSK